MQVCDCSGGGLYIFVPKSCLCLLLSPSHISFVFLVLNLMFYTQTYPEGDFTAACS